MPARMLTEAPPPEIAHAEFLRLELLRVVRPLRATNTHMHVALLRLVAWPTPVLILSLAPLLGIALEAFLLLVAAGQGKLPREINTLTPLAPILLAAWEPPARLQIKVQPPHGRLA